MTLGLNAAQEALRLRLREPGHDVLYYVAIEHDLTLAIDITAVWSDGETLTLNFDLGGAQVVTLTYTEPVTAPADEAEMAAALASQNPVLTWSRGARVWIRLYSDADAETLTLGGTATDYTEAYRTSGLTELVSGSAPVRSGSNTYNPGVLEVTPNGVEWDPFTNETSNSDVTLTLLWTEQVERMIRRTPLFNRAVTVRRGLADVDPADWIPLGRYVITEGPLADLVPGVAWDGASERDVTDAAARLALTQKRARPPLRLRLQDRFKWLLSEAEWAPGPGDELGLPPLHPLENLRRLLVYALRADLANNYPSWIDESSFDPSDAQYESVSHFVTSRISGTFDNRFRAQQITTLAVGATDASGLTANLLVPAATTPVDQQVSPGERIRTATDDNEGAGFHVSATLNVSALDLGISAPGRVTAPNGDPIYPYARPVQYEVGVQEPTKIADVVEDLLLITPALVAADEDGIVRARSIDYQSILTGTANILDWTGVFVPEGPPESLKADLINQITVDLTADLGGEREFWQSFFVARDTASQAAHAQRRVLSGGNADEGPTAQVLKPECLGGKSYLCNVLPDTTQGLRPYASFLAPGSTSFEVMHPQVGFCGARLDLATTSSTPPVAPSLPGWAELNAGASRIATFKIESPEGGSAVILNTSPTPNEFPEAVEYLECDAVVGVNGQSSPGWREWQQGNVQFQISGRYLEGSSSNASSIDRWAFPTRITDATIARYVSGRILDRFGWGFPRFKGRTPLSEMNAQVGDFVSFPLRNLLDFEGEGTVDVAMVFQVLGKTVRRDHVHWTIGIAVRETPYIVRVARPTIPVSSPAATVVYPELS